MMPYWIALGAAICVSLGGQVLLKAGATGALAEPGLVAQVMRWQTIIGLGCYGVSALLYIIALRKIPMSVALPCTAASYIVVAFIGHFVFGEALGPQRLAAIVLISAGVLLLASA
ncbi:multidrug transporter EmrE-like cation transporter [Humitalea rosea]|uniref:Multidrug transporter EmrE-like cation transporter n=1 Tax=Humitalea rosea TaxID=990373 RepID=A0A2W7IKE8_9PROT|nr:EamA family transporter [Humitalea rosea]PZW39847.1 multidrug transporter EmrE-like cation transporter [Humitalea rosea]